jgi:NAD(P)-dependent dehydrogenase (short-subunit alcohol dehydrogenase family)
VVVTGATGALGRAVVQRLLEAGARVTAPVREGSAVPDELAAAHRVDGVDLRDEDDVAHLYEQAQAAHGPLWASVHVAGGFSMAPLVDTELSDLKHLLELNTITCFLCCREAARRMGEAGGRIVTVSAKPALVPSGGAAAYTASKAAVAGLTTALAEELAPRRIWVNAVVPSLIDTPSNREAMPDADHGSWPTPAEIAASIEHLASPANQVTRGALVPVYGNS